MTQVIIWLGSSLGNKQETLNNACKEIKKLGENFKVSSYTESKPWWWVAKETFLNGACVIDTKLSPNNFLKKLQSIEDYFWRKRDKRWDDRTLDLDILYFWDISMNTKKLQIPHPEIQNRDFVKDPILELFPDFRF